MSTDKLMQKIIILEDKLQEVKNQHSRREIEARLRELYAEFYVRQKYNKGENDGQA